MKAIVAGATGFVGKSLVERLLEKKYEVIVLLRDERQVHEAWRDKVRFVVCPNERIKDLDEVCADRDVDIFFSICMARNIGSVAAGL